MKYIHDDYGNKYRCGIHLYADTINPQGVGYFEKLSNYRRQTIALILCKYEKAVATDGEQIVALKVTPIRIIKQS